RAAAGGDPMRSREMEPLCARLAEAGCHITIETAGTVFHPVACHLASLSPKLANSTPHHRDGGRFALKHDAMRLQPDVLRAFLGHCPYQLKFVVDQPGDIDEILRLLDRLPPVEPTLVLLMPQGVTRAELAARCP